MIQTSEERIIFNKLVEKIYKELKSNGNEPLPLKETLRKLYFDYECCYTDRIPTYAQMIMKLHTLNFETFVSNLQGSAKIRMIKLRT